MFAELLQDRLRGVMTVTPAQIATLEAHYNLLLRWNRVLNLTSIRSPEEIVERHYCESLFLGSHLPSGALRIADIGSGAGFPGVPLAVLRADCSLTLIEAHARKAVFLRESSRKLSNVHVLAKRAEDVDEFFDVAVSRAVSYDDLGRSLKRITRRADLLTGAEAPPPGLGFEWAEGIPLPWGRQRYLRIGVSRET